MKLCKASPKTDAEELIKNGFKCGNTLVYVPDMYVCDGDSDCQSGDDETDQACSALPGDLASQYGIYFGADRSAVVYNAEASSIYKNENKKKKKRGLEDIKSY